MLSFKQKDTFKTQNPIKEITTNESNYNRRRKTISTPLK